MDSKTCDAFNRLSDILDTLRTQCPWDRVQTMPSLRHLTIEEVYELSEAILEIENWKSKVDNSSAPADDTSANSQFSILNSQLKKELGDLAMHVMFYAKIAEQEGLFTMADMYNAVCDKLVERHPFIYHTADYHGESWEQLKMREGRRNVLEGVPDSLPTLIKALRMQQKVAGVAETENGERRTENGEGARRAASANEDLGARLAAMLESGAASEEEFGDLLFALVDWGRRHSLNADDALAAANLRFRQEHAANGLD